MTDIRQVLEYCLDNEDRLNHCMLRAKVLADELRIDHLKIWLDLELTGYVGPETPDYRRQRGRVIGEITKDLIGNRTEVVPTQMLDGVFELVSVATITYSLDQINGLPDDGTTLVRCPMQEELLWLVNHQFPPDVRFLWIAVQLPRGSLKRVQTAIYTKLISLLSELNAELGPSTSSTQVAENPNVDRIVDRHLPTIYAQNVFVGESIEVKTIVANIGLIGFGDWHALDNLLGEFDLDEQTREEIKPILDALITEDMTPEKEEAVQSWLDKAADEAAGEAKGIARDVARDTVKKYLTDAITKYAPVLLKTLFYAGMSVV